MSMSNEERKDEFLVGGRYRNRNGEYEILEINNLSLRVQYDDGDEAVLDAVIQARIFKNMALENRRLEPYSGSDSQSKNERFFRSLGYLASRATMLEAIVHPKAQDGFVATYFGITGQLPSNGQVGYYVHVPSTDKWGNELRVTFTATNEEKSELDLGPGVNIVVNPGHRGSWRINKNSFWWSLLKLGFKMGSQQSLDKIAAKVPRPHKGDFDTGVTAGR